MASHQCRTSRTDWGMAGGEVVRNLEMNKAKDGKVEWPSL